MSTNDSNTQARGVEQIRASLERITREFDNMIGRMQMDNATIRMLSDRLPPLANRGQSKPGGAAIPAGWQSFIESQARQKAAGKELVAAAGLGRGYGSRGHRSWFPRPSYGTSYVRDSRQMEKVQRSD